MDHYQVGVIGAGNMAEALLRGALSANVIDHKSVVASDPLLPRRQLFTRELGITCVDDNCTPGACPHVALAVKPQVMPAVLDSISEVVRPDAVVVTIAAGVRTQFISDKLAGKGRIVRVMPNTPMLVGSGISALAGGPRASEAELVWTQKLFAACGKTVRVDEAMMDAVTALSGSGPAYFFYLIEAMIAAALAEGMDEDTATELAVQTFVGAAKLLTDTNQAPRVLRAKVTSPGGTTQAAIESLDADGADQAIIRAVRAAAKRSKELGG